VSDRTYTAYGQAYSSLISFCRTLGYEVSSGVSPQQLAEYIAWLSLQGKSPATTANYVAGIAFWHKTRLLPNLAANALISRLLSGVRRGRVVQDQRSPITGKILLLLLRVLPSVTASGYENLMFKAAFSLAFFGFLRLGEFTALSKRQQGAGPLGASDVQLLGQASSRVVVVRLRRSKNNQHGPAQRVSIEAGQDRDSCPVRAISEYMAARPPGATAFLCHFDLTPLCRHEFQRLLKKATAAAGLDTQHYSSHSFRIGAAT